MANDRSSDVLRARRCWTLTALVVVAASAIAQGADPASPTGANAPTNAPGIQNDAKSWPLFRGNAQAQGVARTELPEKPVLLWEFTIDKGAFDATAVIVDGTVFIGDLDGKLYALNLKTGQKQWEYATEG